MYTKIYNIYFKIHFKNIFNILLMNLLRYLYQIAKMKILNINLQYRISITYKNNINKFK